MKREKDILIIWNCYILTIKKVLMNFRDILSTIVLIITIIKDEAVSHASSRFLENDFDSWPKILLKENFG